MYFPVPSWLRRVANINAAFPFIERRSCSRRQQPHRIFLEACSLGDAGSYKEGSCTAELVTISGVNRNFAGLLVLYSFDISPSMSPFSVSARFLSSN